MDYAVSMQLSFLLAAGGIQRVTIWKRALFALNQAGGAGSGQGPAFSYIKKHFCFFAQNGAGDEARTRYLHLGKVALYQMSYARV